MGRGGGGRRHRGRSTAEVAGVEVGVEGGRLAGRHRGGGTQRRGTAEGVGEEVRGRRGWPETSRSGVQRRAGREAGEEGCGVGERRRALGRRYAASGNGGGCRGWPGSGGAASGRRGGRGGGCATSGAAGEEGAVSGTTAGVGEQLARKIRGQGRGFGGGLRPG